MIIYLLSVGFLVVYVTIFRYHNLYINEVEMFMTRVTICLENLQTLENVTDVRILSGDFCTVKRNCQEGGGKLARDTVHC